MLFSILPPFLIFVSKNCENKVESSKIFQYVLLIAIFDRWRINWCSNKKRWWNQWWAIDENEDSGDNIYTLIWWLIMIFIITLWPMILTLMIHNITLIQSNVHNHHSLYLIVWRQPPEDEIVSGLISREEAKPQFCIGRAARAFAAIMFGPTW